MPQDFSGKNLQGRSFKNQVLTEANFSDADIRGANFTNAILIGVNFSRVKAGLQHRWRICLLINSLLLAILSGFFSALAGAFAGALLNVSDPSYVFAGFVTLIMFAVLFIVTIQ